MAAEALVSMLLERLASVAFKHTKGDVTLVLNAEEELERFSSHLKAIEAVLEDAEQKQVRSVNVGLWLDKLKDVCYEMDSVLDEWNTEILKQQVEESIKEGESDILTKKKKVCFSIDSIFSCFGQAFQTKTISYRIAIEIKDLNEKLDLVAAQRDMFAFQLTSISTDRSLNQRMGTTFLVDESRIFGREETTTNLVSKLLSGTSEEEGKGVIIIPIVGMGGIGKTTLAQLAYNHEIVKSHFDLRVWVCVSESFDVLRIASSIVQSLDYDAPHSTALEYVLLRMSGILKGRKCLIVLDDVWTEVSRIWETLNLPMQSCAEGSRILVTTRSEGVAKMMRATTHMIHLEKLSDESSLALFNSLAYLNREEDETNGFGAIGEEIAKKCNGLPLAAKVLGALVRDKRSKSEWLEILRSKIWDLHEVEESVFQPLLISYYNLTPVAKRCLLYCVIFPKDYRFKKYNLIELWLSQDYLIGKDYKEKEMGGHVFDTLIMQSFFQDVEEEVSDVDKSIVICCKMHDIVHDFLQFLNKKECFTAEAKGTMILSDEVRHLSLIHAPYGSPTLDFVSPVNCKKLRTLATFDSRMTSIDVKAISLLRCLRTLNLSRNDIAELPEMGGLAHLRFLDLSENIFLEELPDSLCKLCNLQTLCLTRCGSLRRLPENMGNLISLRHLHNKGCHQLEYLPRGIRRITNLQTLDWCPVSHDSGPIEALKLGDLGSLDRLEGSLNIYIKGNLMDISEAQKAYLRNKKLYNMEICFRTLGKQSHIQVLEALRPHHDLETLQISWYSGTSTPSWMISLQNLRSLSFNLCVKCQVLPPLGTLSCLEQLSVSGMDEVKTVGDEFLGTTDSQKLSSSRVVFFPRLKHLSFKFMCEWEKWEGVGGDGITIMPCLLSLTIDDCPKLMNLPLFLQQTPVRRIFLRECRQSIIMPVWPDNCDITIYEEIEDSVVPYVTGDRVETEIQIHRDEEITIIS